MTEHQLRKALSAANELEPPTDELFTQRALQRGRARAARRRHAIVGAAAGLALVGGLGGMWLALNQPTGGVSASSGSSEERAQAGSADGAPYDSQVPSVAAVPPAKDSSAWITGPETPQRAAFDALVPTLTLYHADVFGGAYATDATNTHIVVTVTRRDPRLEALVTQAMPAPTDVTFEVVANTAARKQEVARRVVADASGWLAKGYPVLAVRVDARTDRVVVTVRQPESVAAIEAYYGPDIVRAETGVGPPLGGTVPGGTTLPTLQH